ncbi:hypothetical protein K503DRAFT_719662 [Rhizopogon vinicolor AM-OR11-026]|uniref:DUF6593 domain-containing protein n=1 Tax=Rhizopogon vinicolor AM-OR11-026 TaxID=1314800 RepID=A0A1B7MY48_9AGAM|nr:hypothetical protein K503DRAFT_719662 [Rhizopogon vinicolor AM-OR11-026]
MTLRIALAKNDPLQTTFSCPERAIHYASDTVTRDKAVSGSTATTTVVRRNVLGDSDHVGIIEWPANPNDRPAVVVGSKTVEMIQTGLYTSPEKFQGSDHEWYEWQISNSRPQLVLLNGTRAQTCTATFITSFTHHMFGLKRNESAALLIPPEAESILDDIVVTFIYFESQWRERERAKSRSWDTSFTAGGALTF